MRAAALSTRLGLVGTLVGVAFPTGLDLATRDLPQDAFAAPVLAELGVS